MFYLADFSNIEEARNPSVPIPAVIGGGAVLSGAIGVGAYNHPDKVKIRQNLKAQKAAQSALKKKWLTKKNIGLGLLGTGAVVGGTMIGKKLYDQHKERNKKWYEL